MMAYSVKMSIYIYSELKQNILSTLKNLHWLSLIIVYTSWFYGLFVNLWVHYYSYIEILTYKCYNKKCNPAWQSCFEIIAYTQSMIVSKSLLSIVLSKYLMFFLSFKNASSIGFRSGKYDDRKWMITPTSSISDTTSCVWWMEQLSMTTTPWLLVIAIK